MSEIEIYRRSEQFIRNDDRRGFHSYHGDHEEYSDQTRSLVRSRIGGSVRGLWPKSPAADHAQELRLILGDKAGLLLTMPLIIFRSRSKRWDISGFPGSGLTFTCRRLQTHHGLWDISRAGTLQRITPLRRRQESTHHPIHF